MNQADHIEILKIPAGGVRLGTLVRLGVSLGWGVDDLVVTGSYSEVVLWRRKHAVGHRPWLDVTIKGFTVNGDALPVVTAAPAPPVLPDAVVNEPEAEPTEQPGPEPGPEPGPFRAALARHAGKTGSSTCECGRKLATHQLMLVHREIDHVSPDNVTCECGQVFSGQAGYKRHHQRAHPPAASGLMVAVPDLPKGPKMLWCGDCDFSTDLATGMNEHTTAEHGRRPTGAERTPSSVSA